MKIVDPNGVVTQLAALMADLNGMQYEMKQKNAEVTYTFGLGVVDGEFSVNFEFVRANKVIGEVAETGTDPANVIERARGAIAQIFNV